MIAQGFNSTDAKRLGFEQQDVKVDHGDGRGAVVAQADFLAGLLDVLVGGRLRRRISSEFDQDGKEYWARQIAVGHENDPEVGWVLVQVPDFTTFDPIEAGLLPAGTDPNSPEFFASYQHLIYNYYMEQAADILEIPKQELMKVQMIYGPTLFSLVERVGADPLIAANGVVAGDSFGNGHFLTSGGAMTGMIGHSARVLEYWQARDAGTSPTDAIRRLADSIREDTHAWLQVSAKEYSQAVPINFGAQRIEQISKASGIDTNARANSIEAARRQRHALIPLDPSNWRRLFVRNGKVLSSLPELGAVHPQQHSPQVAAVLAALQALPPVPEQGSADQDLAEAEKTLLKLMPNKTQKLTEAEQTMLRSVLTIDQEPVEGEQTLIRSLAESKSLNSRTRALGNSRPLALGDAKIHAFLDIEQNGRIVRSIPIKENSVIVGRVDPRRGVTPEIDLTSFDALSTVSRQHARIRLEKTLFSIEDLKSRNRTRLGELTLTPLKPELLQNGDVVSFGSVKATFRLPGTSELPAPWSQS
ncbi:MAG: FHA domain-containing protein [Ktedonobacteraceae bacterium]